MAFLLPPVEELPESRHSAVGAWFFGPRAENFDYLKGVFGDILDRQHAARTSIYPNDGEFITSEMKATGLYKKQIELLNCELSSILEMLNWHSVPFWSPRYNAHMSMETSMPSMIGYLAGLMHNQNNVATEASPLTTILEKAVGTELCHMLGYNVDPSDPARAWGHITCGGSVANLESIWSARNLKFYPLSLKLALETGPLASIKNEFWIETCAGTKTRFVECSTWDLLNLKPSTVLSIPDQLYEQFGISQSLLSNEFKRWSIQTVGKDFLEEKFAIKDEPQVFVATTKHYSWPKGGAIAGIGSINIVDVPVDNQARMDMQELRKLLQERLNKKQAVYSVVAIIGSTEHGACDPLADILEIRTEFQRQGLSFVVHCDGAWGGYFAACIRDPTPPSSGRIGGQIGSDKGDPLYVPTLALSPYTRKNLEAFKNADSITIDPHKSGYCPYPAGGMCYRDGRMRFLVTWTSPVVYRTGDDTESIGVYGVEGSKPGAAAVGAWLSHRVIGLNKNGYGSLLGEAIFTCTRLYCHWATMDPAPVKIGDATARLIVTPFIMLPAERQRLSAKEIEDQKQFIRDHIIGKDNKEVFRNEKARNLLGLLGGDLMINAFACNFEIDGKVNEDILEANRFNTFIFNKASLSNVKTDITKIPLYLTSTQFTQTAYLGCLDTYKRRMGVHLGPEDLYSLINVTMSPWSTTNDFIEHISDRFQGIAEEALDYAVKRNAQTKDKHGFIIQGLQGDRICGVHLPMFSMANHRWQLIISCKLPDKEQKILQDILKKDPKTFLTFGNIEPEELEQLIAKGSFEARLDNQIPDDETEPLAKVTVTDVKVLYKRSIHGKDLSLTYPDRMIFYAYSAQRGFKQNPIFNIDHLLNVSPNIQLNADSVTFKTKDQAEQKRAEELVKASGCWFRLNNVYESLIQPLTQTEGDSHAGYPRPGIQFIPGAEYEFEALSAADGPPADDAHVLFAGNLKLGSSIFADAFYINMDVHVEEKITSKIAISSVASIGDSATETPNYGLSAEYPSDNITLEYRNAFQQRAMQRYDSVFLQARAAEARKIVEAEGETPGWAQQLCDRADAKQSGATAKKPPMRLYIGHA